MPKEVERLETQAGVPREEYDSIHRLLSRVLAELPAIGKDAYNEQQKFHFRSHDAVLNALNPLLAKAGIVAVPHVLERLATTRQTRGGAAMYEVNLHVKYTLYGPRGDYVEASAWGEGTDMGDKATNKAMTMAFKNVLAQVFAVSTADTVDSDSQSPQETLHPAAQPPPPAVPARTAKDAASGLTSWMLEPEPWIREAAEVVAKEAGVELPADWTWKDHLAEPERAKTIAGLWKALDALTALTELDPYGDAEVTQAAVRLAFKNAFGADVLGPEPFAPPLPF